jgi:hypothetical protein
MILLPQPPHLCVLPPVIVTFAEEGGGRDVECRVEQRVQLVPAVGGDHGLTDETPSACRSRHVAGEIPTVGSGP